VGSLTVELKNVSAVYEGERIPALHGIDLAAKLGELVAIVGPNGAGKTTLLEVINGLLPIRSGEVLVLGIGPFRLPSWADRRLAREAIAAVGISDLAARPIGRLSGGQQRKALLARVLAKEPQLLLLDEPTTNLDPEAKEEISRLILQIQSTLSLTTLVVSHESGPLLDEANRILTMVGGRFLTDSAEWSPLVQVHGMPQGV
jgi:ABC-type Mn2+/Zn2+ transport system ATPase subunit